jgi:hypothetical protein
MLHIRTNDNSRFRFIFQARKILLHGTTYIEIHYHRILMSIVRKWYILTLLEEHLSLDSFYQN